MTFELQDFIDSPSLEKINACRKDDLLCIAAHFDILVQKHGLKKEIKNKVVEKLVELKVLRIPFHQVQTEAEDDVALAVSSDSDTKREGIIQATPLGGRLEGEGPPATLPRFDPFSPGSSRPSSEARLKVRLARLQFEAQEKERMQKADYDLKLQVRKLEIEAEKEIKLRQLDLEAMRISSGQGAARVTENFASSLAPSKLSFDVGKNIALVPTFRESEVDSYFSAFERIATALDWPKDMWSVLLHCKLVGKAQEVVSSLSLEESLDYDMLKESILRAYELVPEAYRQRFRSHKKLSGQTFVEFAREKGVLFDKWCTSSDVKGDFESLRQLMLLEDFKNALPDKVVVFLNEQKVTSLQKAAILADEFVLTHRNVFVPSSRSDRVPVSRPVGPDTGYHSSEKPKGPTSPPRVNRECFYCRKKGHLIADCLSLKRKQSSSSSSQPKSVALIKSVSHPSPDIFLPQNEDDGNDDNEPDPCFKPFISEGFVSLTGNPADQLPVKVLRDTAGSQSIILKGVLPLSSSTFCGSSVLVQGVGMEFVPAPLHNIYVHSSLVSGLFEVAVLPVLPIKGVDLILGNDLAGGRVLPVPEVLDSPDSGPGSDDVSQKHPGVFPACVVTRAQSRNNDLDLSDTFLVTEQFPNSNLTETECPLNPPDTVSSRFSLGDVRLPATREEFVAAQKSDVTLSKCLSSVLSKEEAQKKRLSYIMDRGLLIRRWASDMDGEWSATYQVVVPSVYRSQVLSLAHDHPWSGHMGVTKTYQRVLKHFFWPGLKSDVVTYCRTCHVCQITGKPNQVIPPAPLHPIPVMGEPFEKVIVDCVGPLPKTKAGNQFLLTVMCASTRFPEAMPLRRITAPVVTKALVKFFTVFGLPRVVQTDQGTNFKSKVFAQALRMLGIKHVMSSTYHPETQGALERFHQTMKSMLRKHCYESEKKWDDSVPLVLFAAREAVQESLGFSPAQLVFGHEVRGPLKVLKEHLITSENSVKNLPEYVAELRSRLQQACSLAREALNSTQTRMKQHYDRKAVVPLIQPGDKVLVLLPIPGSALSNKFSGPYVVEKKLSDTNYVIQTPDRRRGTRVCHVNMLKPYYIREAQDGSSTNQKMKTAVALITESSPDDDGLVMHNATPQGARLSNSEVLSNLPRSLAHLPDNQRADIEKLLYEFPCLFNDIPSQTSVVMHDIVLTNPRPIKQHAYRVNPVKRQIMRKEIDYLVQNGFAVPSSSPWSSPCLLDIKSDGSPRFCTDYRKVNAVTVPDAHPLPLIDDCVDEVGSASFVTKLDLLKGYWQVPLTPRASEISAFVTPDNFLQYTVMPFGMCNAPATFQRLANKVLGDIPNCRSYLDDIVVYSDDWVSHIARLREVFKRLSVASLTLNLAKCEFGKGTVLYLGHQVGSGQVCPVDAKVSAIAEFPVPTTRRELRRFLGMAGYYRRFCKNFSSVAAPLTTLTSPSQPFVWSSECQKAFESLKGILCCTPVLSAPDFSRSFKLEVDASAAGAGAVLLQEDDRGIDHPVSYFSRKFNRHQVKYSTIEKETLALLLALQHYEVYLGSSVRPIQVFTDHNPLVFLSRMYNHNQRLMRWSLILQNYNLEIHHKMGSENILADTLSRAV